VAVDVESAGLDALEPARDLAVVERLRALVPISRELRAAAHAAGIVVLDAPVLAAGRLELRHYLREQSVSRVVHRYGSIMQPAEPADSGG